MTARWHGVTKLLLVSSMSKVDYQYKMLPFHQFAYFIFCFVPELNFWPLFGDIQQSFRIFMILYKKYFLSNLYYMKIF